MLGVKKLHVIKLLMPFFLKGIDILKLKFHW